MLLHEKLYWTYTITTILFTYALKAFSEQLNVINVDDDGITPMENFECTTTDITLKNHHTWGCKIYVSDEIFQGNITGIPKWEPQLCAGIYIGQLPFHEGSVALVLNPETGHVSPQFHVVLDNEFSTVPFMREVTIPLNWTDLSKHSSQSGAPDNIDLRDNWSNPDLEEYPRKNPTYMPIVAP